MTEKGKRRTMASIKLIRSWIFQYMGSDLSIKEIQKALKEEHNTDISYQATREHMKKVADEIVNETTKSNLRALVLIDKLREKRDAKILFADARLYGDRKEKSVALEQVRRSNDGYVELLSRLGFLDLEKTNEITINVVEEILQKYKETNLDSEVAHSTPTKRCGKSQKKKVNAQSETEGEKT